MAGLATLNRRGQPDRFRTKVPTMAQKHAEKNRHAETEDIPETETPQQNTSNIATDEVDDLLSDIDDVLEENAEQFVRSYVQKGGQ